MDFLWFRTLAAMYFRPIPLFISHSIYLYDGKWWSSLFSGKLKCLLFSRRLCFPFSLPHHVWCWVFSFSFCFSYFFFLFFFLINPISWAKHTHTHGRKEKASEWAYVICTVCSISSSKTFMDFNCGIKTSLLTVTFMFLSFCSCLGLTSVTFYFFSRSISCSQISIMAFRSI